MARNPTRFLESAVALSEELNYSLAAEKIHVSQSTITKNIQDLERSLGKQLFMRNRKNVTVTDAGRAYVEYARISLLYGERAFHAARTVVNEADELQHVGRSPYTDPFFLSTLRSIHLPLFPLLNIKSSSQFSYDLVHDLLSGAIDLAIANNPPASPLLTMTKLAESPYYIGLSRKDELAKYSSVTIEALADRCWVIFERRLHPLMYDAVMKVAEEHHVVPSEIQHVTAPEEAFPFVANGDCVVFLTKPGAVRVARNGVTVRPLTEEALRVNTYLISLADNKSKVTSELVRAFGKRLDTIAKESHIPPAQSA
jgi:DNA-binding transcriptional LysR family regulator